MAVDEALVVFSHCWITREGFFGDQSITTFVLSSTDFAYYDPFARPEGRLNPEAHREGLPLLLRPPRERPTRAS
jgi:hypothetical protein